MPYINEYADKSSHSDIVNNPDIKEFLNNCTYMREPSENDIKDIVDKFIKVPYSNIKLPDNIISIDGSYYEASIRENIPCTRVGYVKIGNLLIKRNAFNSLRNGSNFVDPFKVAALKENNSAITFAFPSSNMKYKENTSVRDGFRLALDEILYNRRTNPADPKTSIRTTLFHLASYRNEDVNIKDRLIIHKCPTCKAEKLEVKDIAEAQYCKNCNSRIYPSDCLRIWEEVSDDISNCSALNRFMNVIEHIFVIHYIRVIKEANPQSYVDIINNLCFFIDGPLAIFGNSAWIHTCIMKFLDEINQEMRKYNKMDVMILGLQKSGYVYDYLQLISKHIDNNTIYCLEDDIRYRYIIFDEDKKNATFGNETYYGQDFLYKTDSGRIFVFNVPYPFKDKKNIVSFSKNKVDINNYKNISAYVDMLQDFECDLYENAVVPIALAHRYTAISLEPGGKVLDILSKNISN